MATTWSQSSGDLAATWSSSSGDKAATWTKSSGEIAAAWLATELIQFGFLSWEDVEDNYEDIVSEYYTGIDAISGNWEDLG